ncbi:MAG: hypothetical protein OXU62_06965 [Gammaproteobacteria bacterium]|nr:hypothetical protein [Gammaproteobacteria bacterium]
MPPCVFMVLHEFAWLGRRGIIDGVAQFVCRTKLQFDWFFVCIGLTTPSPSCSRCAACGLCAQRGRKLHLNDAR